ncbi:MAG TPA: lysylphosphatidylglycerol synthase transmembrane domain-containing protein [Aridibacter sp.]|nr:lysylphosphatidylglycerol synthase transmembrane domain-containing protein [Aridibacter sp.]
MSKYLKFAILLIVTILIIWFFGRNLDWQQVWDSLMKARAIYVVPSVLIICLGYLVRAKRWQVLLEPITRTSLRELFATTTVGFTAVFFIGRAGEIVRPMWLPMRDRRVRPSAAFVTLGLERIFDLAAIISFFAVNLLWFAPPAGKEAEFYYVRLAGYLMLAGVAAGFVFLRVFHKYSEWATGFVGRLLDFRFFPRRVRRIILSLMRQLAFSLDMLRDWREIASVTFWTIVLWVAIAVPTWFVMLAFDLPYGLDDALFIMGWAAVGSVVPTPGGAAGAFHAATAGGLIFLNTSRDEAVAVSIVMHLVYFAPAVIFGLYYLLRGDISIAGVKHLLSSVMSVEELERDEEKLVADSGAPPDSEREDAL